MFKYTHCPVCNGTGFSHFITCKDHTVSHKKFDIVTCSNCSFKFTNPRPENSDLGNYYKSEDYISHSNTKQGVVARLYHLVRNYTLRQKLKLISKYVSRGTILDYGCGTGMFLNVCQNSGWKTLGMEPDSDARKIAGDLGIEVFKDRGDLEKATESTSFNAITLWHVLEHVTDLIETLNFFKSKLSAGGVLVIAVPNHTSEDAKHYKEFWAAYDVPRHLYHFEPRTLQLLLGKYGFSLIETLPMKFDSFYVSMLSEKYKTGTVNYFKAFLNGLKSNLRASGPKGYSSVIYIFKIDSAS
jgi:SAM-dependent methyltransferase